ncbi:MAG: cache domain-containing protein [Candidatus Riflebacteria bacterium]|nr:cache domain-containing protein [Candidatus Riflebacteria bacterium]
MKYFLVRSVIPTLLTIALFITAIFFFMLPALEKSIMDQKKEMIKELTTAAWNILARFEYDERNGVMTREQAQKLAIEAVQNLHYGQGMKDYFWINDMHPRMIIHPYRTDLNGKDLTNITDPSGNHLFVRFVEIVKAQNAGYVEYLWQWKDDPTRISPKLSYVKGFEPWGWIVGTGVYLNDARQEIDSIRNNLIFFSSAILLIATGLLAFLLAGSYLSEKRRKFAELNLRESEEKYRVLVESAGEYMIMSLCGQDLFANNSMLRLLDYSAEEFMQKNILEIVEMSPAEKALGYPYSVALMKGEAYPHQYETWLIKKSGERYRIMMYLSSIPQGNKAGYLMIASEVTTQQERVIRQDRLLEELQRSFLYFHQRIADLASLPAIICPTGETLQSVARHFQPEGIDAVLVEDSSGIRGVLSLQTYIQMLLTGHYDLKKTTLADIKLEEPVYVDESSLLFDVYLKIEKSDFNHVFVVNSRGTPVGLVNNHSFIFLQNYSPTILLREIQLTTSEEALTTANRMLPELTRVFINNQIGVGHLSRLISDVADLILEKAIELSLKKLGPPPADFCFMVLGSQGRREQTLCTDQDNAIIFADVEEKDKDQAQQYFLKLGESVCTLLDRSGYKYCDGEIMAKNPAWCLPLSGWKTNFSTWINTLEAKDLLQAKIFFDFRVVNEPGNRSAYLVEKLQQHLENELANSPRFYFLLAINILQYDPPLGFFGDFIVETRGQHADVLDIKSVLSMIIDFTRIYALKYGIRARNTHERLMTLNELGVLGTQSHDDLERALNYLMTIRLENQAEEVNQGLKPDNYIKPDRLTSINQKILKEIFAQIKNFQVKLSYDFTGTMGAK